MPAVCEATHKSFRSLIGDRAEVRISGEGKGRQIAGYASVFYDGTPETEFRIFDDFVERIMPGAFDKTLKDGDDVRALFNHNPSMILGRTSSDTLALSIDKRGLRFSVDLGDTTVARDVLAHVERGDVTGSSFGFEITDQEFRMEDKVEIREITGVRLFDVGPVTFPAYDATEVDARAEAEGLRANMEVWRTNEERKRLLTRKVKRLEWRAERFGWDFS